MAVVKNERIERAFIKVGVAAILIGAGTLLVDDMIADYWAHQVHHKPSTPELSSAESTIKTYREAQQIVATYLSPEDAQKLDTAPPLLQAREIVGRHQLNRAYRASLMGLRPIAELIVGFAGIGLAFVGQTSRKERQAIMQAANS